MPSCHAFAVAVAAAGIGSLCGCGDPPAATARGTELRMDFARTTRSLYDAPFPSDDLARPDGTIDLALFQNPHGTPLIAATLSLLAGSRGFATTGAVYFGATGKLDPARFPPIAATVAADSPVFLVDLTETAPGVLRRHPLELAFLPDPTDFADGNLLALLPLQGVPLRPRATFAAVVLRRLGDAQGDPLVPSAAMRRLAGATPAAPDGMSAAVFARYRDALATLAAHGTAPSEIAAIAVFTTGDPTDELGRFRQAALALPVPAPLAPLRRTDTFPDYCVYAGAVAMPVYQGGTPPYSRSGGAWVTDATGAPVLQRMETAGVVVTIPRAPSPAAGYPVVTLMRTGAGGDRPLVDRGTCATEHYTQPIDPGTGPARYFARAGYAGASVDGPLGGLRNPQHLDEQFLIFNITNPAALRDNVRQSALGLDVEAHILATLSVDASDCPGATSPARFDAAHIALFGHSMGATIAPLAVAREPLFGAAVLSGAGGSWIENVIYKEQPVKIRPFAEALLGYAPGTLTAFDPVLTLVQWALEPADPQVYDALVVAGAPPRHVLMEQGIVDHYILPRIANTTSLSLGLDLGGAPLDGDPRYVGEALAPLLPLVGRKRVTLPAAGNGPSGVTSVVVQHAEDGVEDGHEVVFQEDAPKHQYRCFLETWKKGTPVVVPDGKADDPCP